MVDIKDLIDLGLRCPQCRTTHIRGGYHDWQTMDSFICEDCGLHWNEDFKINAEEHLWLLKSRRFIWVMCDAKHPLIPLLNPDSADGSTGRRGFVQRGLYATKKVLTERFK